MLPHFSKTGFLRNVEQFFSKPFSAARESEKVSTDKNQGFQGLSFIKWVWRHCLLLDQTIGKKKSP